MAIVGKGAEPTKVEPEAVVVNDKDGGSGEGSIGAWDARPQD